MYLLKKNLPLIAMAFALLALFCGLTMPAIEIKGVVGYTGDQISFGKLLYDNDRYAYFNFSFMNTLTYLFVIGGTVAVLLGVISGNRLFSLAAAGAFGLATILFFCALAFTEFPSSGMKSAFDLGKGSIFAAICAGLAAACAAAPVAMDMLNIG